MLALLTLSHMALAAPEPVTGPRFDDDFVEDVNRKWRGLGIGYDNGLWGSHFAQSLKFDIPFGPKVGQFWGLRLKGQQLHALPGSDVWLMGGGGEIFGRGPVVHGIVRTYGGGGAWVMSDLDGETAVSVGGHFGVETYFHRRGSLHIEIGGQSGAFSSDQGASVVAGTTFYLGDLGG